MHNKIELNKDSIVIGCNYHTTWQSNKAMRFVLKEIKGDQARLFTRNTRKDFWTNTSGLIFIMTSHNISKAVQLLKNIKESNAR
jgi:hypothetical protein